MTKPQLSEDQMLRAMAESVALSEHRSEERERARWRRESLPDVVARAQDHAVGAASRAKWTTDPVKARELRRESMRRSQQVLQLLAKDLRVSPALVRAQAARTKPVRPSPLPPRPRRRLYNRSQPDVVVTRTGGRILGVR
jgi:hypothetical protein